MSLLPENIPLSLYIHLPWCIQKCPYCDFNSHALKGDLPEQNYIASLLNDLQQDIPKIHQRSIRSIFFGGGTPSLFSPDSIALLLEKISKLMHFDSNIEITLEANPGTVEQQRFKNFRHAGINRLSIGIQSFQDDKLKTLGRIHDGENAKRAVTAAINAGFDNFNLDLMFGLPKQSLTDALSDLKTAIEFNPNHISWYQLTLEPNTFFYHQPPQLPEDDLIWEIQTQGQTLLRENNFIQYEVSAYAKPNQECQHNLNYWKFGDYLGIGAGAHGKLTLFDQQQILRTSKTKHPKAYLSNCNSYTDEEKIIATQEIPFEFMLNALRLSKPISWKLFSERTGLAKNIFNSQLLIAQEKELLQIEENHFYPTLLGKKYLNDLLQIFLPINSIHSI